MRLLSSARRLSIAAIAAGASLLALSLGVSVRVDNTLRAAASPAATTSTATQVRALRGGVGDGDHEARGHLQDAGFKHHPDGGHGRGHGGSEL